MSSKQNNKKNKKKGGNQPKAMDLSTKPLNLMQDDDASPNDGSVTPSTRATTQPSNPAQSDVANMKQIDLDQQKSQTSSQGNGQQTQSTGAYFMEQLTNTLSSFPSIMGGNGATLSKQTSSASQIDEELDKLLEDIGGEGTDKKSKSKKKKEKMKAKSASNSKLSNDSSQSQNVDDDQKFQQSILKGTQQAGNGKFTGSLGIPNLANNNKSESKNSVLSFHEDVDTPIDSIKNKSSSNDTVNMSKISDFTLSSVPPSMQPSPMDSNPSCLGTPTSSLASGSQAGKKKNKKPKSEAEKEKLIFRENFRANAPGKTAEDQQLVFEVKELFKLEFEETFEEQVSKKGGYKLTIMLNEKGELCAFIMYKVMPEKKCLSIANVAVPHNKRRMGYGKQVVRWAIGHARKLSRQLVQFLALSSLPTSIKFYQALGFKKEEKLKKKKRKKPSTGSGSGVTGQMNMVKNSSPGLEFNANAINDISASSTSFKSNPLELQQQCSFHHRREIQFWMQWRLETIEQRYPKQHHAFRDQMQQLKFLNQVESGFGGGISSRGDQSPNSRSASNKGDQSPRLNLSIQQQQQQQQLNLKGQMSNRAWKKYQKQQQNEQRQKSSGTAGSGSPTNVDQKQFISFPSRAKTGSLQPSPQDGEGSPTIKLNSKNLHLEDTMSDAGSECLAICGGNDGDHTPADSTNYSAQFSPTGSDVSSRLGAPLSSWASTCFSEASTYSVRGSSACSSASASQAGGNDDDDDSDSEPEFVEGQVYMTYPLKGR